MGRTTTSRQRQAARKARVRRQRRVLGSMVLVALIATTVTALALGVTKHSGQPAKSQPVTPKAGIVQAAPQAATPAASSATYTVRFDVSENTGAQVTPSELALPVGSSPAKLPYAFLEDKRFIGWYTGPADDTEATCIDNSMLSLISTSTSSTLYARFESAPQGVDYEVRGLPVLMYHDFYDPEAGETAGGAYAADKLKIQTFKKQLVWLRDNDYYFPDWNEVLAFTQGKILLPKKSVVLTCDDGSPNFFKLAIPAVEQYQAHITGFLIGSRISEGQIDLSSYDSRSVSFESHSYDLHIGNASGDGLITTASESKIIQDIELETQVIGPHSVFCYPFGRTDRDYSKREEKILAANGYDLAFTVRQGRVYPGLNPLALPRMRVSAPCSMETFRALIR